MSATFTKSVKFLGKGDYAALINGQEIGYASTHTAAQALADDYVYQALARENVSAADLTPEDAEAVLVSQMERAQITAQGCLDCGQEECVCRLTYDGPMYQEVPACPCCDGPKESARPADYCGKCRNAFADGGNTATGRPNWTRGVGTVKSIWDQCYVQGHIGLADCPICSPAHAADIHTDTATPQQQAPATEAHTITPEINPANGRYEFAVRIGAMHCGYAGSNLAGEALAAEIKAARSAA